MRPQGGDTRAGDIVVEAGSVLGPPQVSALAAAGVAVVRCARRPRVAVLATGSELRAPGEPLALGEIYESNSVLIAAQLEQSGAQATVFPPVADDPAAGPPHAVVFDTKPIAFAVRGDTLVFGLPGNPVSALVGLELFVRPALRALQGAREPGPHYLPGRLAQAVPRNAQRDELVRARRDGDQLAPLSGQDSHMIVRAAAANALVLVPRGDGDLAQGSQVSYLQI